MRRRGDRIVAKKIIADSCRYSGEIRDAWRVLLDSLSLSRHGESSSELVSVMILDPVFGNSLWKANSLSDSKTSHEQ
jgi:hypothetical protein